MFTIMIATTLCSRIHEILAVLSFEAPIRAMSEIPRKIQYEAIGK